MQESYIQLDNSLSDFCVYTLSGNFYGMKAVLSYHHSAQKTKNRLRDVDHLLVVPFIQVADTSMPK